MFLKCFILFHDLQFSQETFWVHSFLDACTAHGIMVALGLKIMRYSTDLIVCTCCMY
ncbi:hypothetical protein BHE74_00035817 [Ensete ventricosum]|nr:hypothetical protein BHE74_00035817 [Ensete ventricosum]RZS29081.1 hypothetical protein BHM03_00062761 [Ensete ventricosum]